MRVKLIGYYFVDIMMWFFMFEMSRREIRLLLVTENSDELMRAWTRYKKRVYAETLQTKT